MSKLRKLRFLRFIHMIVLAVVILLIGFLFTAEGVPVVLWSTSMTILCSNHRYYSHLNLSVLLNNGRRV